MQPSSYGLEPRQWLEVGPSRSYFLHVRPRSTAVRSCLHRVRVTLGVVLLEFFTLGGEKALERELTIVNIFPRRTHDFLPQTSRRVSPYPLLNA